MALTATALCVGGVKVRWGPMWAQSLVRQNKGGYVHSDFGEHMSMVLCPKPPSVQCKPPDCWQGKS